jgi:hypothetical protein
MIRALNAVKIPAQSDCFDKLLSANMGRILWEELRRLNPRANYTNQATSACRRSKCQLFLPHIIFQDTANRRTHRTVVPNLRYAYPWGYAADRLGLRENNIGNGEKHPKKGVKIKTRKQSYEVLVYKERLIWKLSLDPPTTSHIIILMLFLFVLILC